MRRFGASVGLVLLGIGCGDDAGSAGPDGGSDATGVATAGTAAGDPDTTAGPQASSGSSGAGRDTSAVPEGSTSAAETSTGGRRAESDSGGGDSSGGETAPSVDGWAGVAGDGIETTTGGAAGEVVGVANIDDLIFYAEADEPYVIQLSGTITGEVRPTSNKTIEGLAGAELIGSIVITGDPGAQVSNVIVRNLSIRMDNCPGDGCSGGDTVRVYQAHHVWIDHCDISDGDDGNLDITEESDYVTVSWSIFSYSDDTGGHRFSNLIGASDASVGDADDLRITLHHNWWTANVRERMPRVRFGPVHVFNNYYTPGDDGYCIRPGFEANLLVEGNYFEGANEPFDAADPTASILAVGNAFAGSPDDEPSQGDVFDPPYAYELDAAQDVPRIVMAGAGPG